MSLTSSSYGDNYASIGSVNASDVGKYKITQGFTPVGASTINNNSACTGNGEYVGCIASPTYDGMSQDCHVVL